LRLTRCPRKTVVTPPLTGDQKGQTGTGAPSVRWPSLAQLGARRRQASALEIPGTTTVPIVFATGGDPLAWGLVNSLNRPGGNITGVSFLSSALGAKQLELLHRARDRASGQLA
jgi:hypothetical protein